MSGGFEDLGLMPELVRATQEQGWTLPSDVQDESIPLIMGGGDVMVAAETGSGKTGAFALPAIQIVHELRRDAATAAAAAASSSSSSTSTSSSSSSSNAGNSPTSKKARVAPEIILNGNDRSSMVAISPDGFSAQCRQEKDWGGARATFGILVKAGNAGSTTTTNNKVYYEAIMNDEGLCRVGWSTQAAVHDLGKDKHGYGYGGTGKKSNGGSFESYGEEFKMGDVIGCCLTLASSADSGAVIGWCKNGKYLGDAFKVPANIGTLYPAICMKNAELSVNFGGGGGGFKFPPPAGFVGLATSQDLLVGASTTSAGAAGGGGGGSAVGAGAGGGGQGGQNTKKNKANSNSSHPICIVLEPARDLALQTGKAFDDLKRFVSTPSIGCGVLIGGMPNSFTREQVTKATDIVVATPQSLLTSLKAGDIALDQVRLFILDEADRFTEAENLEMVDKLYAELRSAIDVTKPESGRLQVCFFSATLHSAEIADLSAKLCKHPTWVDLKGKDSVPETVHHVIIPVDPSDDRSWLADNVEEVPTDGVHANDVNISALNGGSGAGGKNSGAGGGGASGAFKKKDFSREEKSEGIKRLKPRMLVSLIDSLSMTQCLIFCRTNVDCDNLEAYLTKVGGGNKWRAGMEKGKENPYSCCVLAGMRSQEERTRNLQAFKDGDVRFLICTDVAARGLDISGLPYVVNMTLPDETENYIHRIGRVGRADRMGLAISLVATHADEKVWFHTCGSRGGKGCRNTALVNMKTKSGGCCTWYDEPTRLGAIFKRLGVQTLPSMQVTHDGIGPKGKVLPYVFALPPEILALGADYGEEKGAKQETSSHVLAIQTQVTSLLKLEVQAQAGYLALKLKFGGGGSGKNGGGGSGLVAGMATTKPAGNNFGGSSPKAAAAASVVGAGGGGGKHSPKSKK